MSAEPARHPMLQSLTRMSGFVLRFVDRAAEGVVILLFAGILLVGGLQVFCRYILNASLTWSEEFQRYGLIWMVFLALVIGCRKHAHIGMELLSKKLPASCQTLLGWTTDLLWLSLGLAMVVFTAFYNSAAGMTFLASVKRQRSAGMDVRMDLIYACIVVGGAYLILAASHHLLQRAAGAAPAAARKDAEPC